MIRSATVADAPEISAIYNHYVLNSCITFEEEAVSAADMAARIRDVTESLPWLVLEDNDHVVGYAYASKWKSRCAYRYAVESTIYLRQDALGRGLGRELYQRLISDLRHAGMHSVIGGVALPNAASQRLHEALGFKKVAHFEQVGWKFDQWIDVGYWEYIFPPQP